MNRETIIEAMAQAMSVADESRCLTYDEIATAALAAIEAAGVRLVPVEATAEMIAMAEMLYTVDELTTDEYRAAYRVMTAYSPYALLRAGE